MIFLQLKTNEDSMKVLILIPFILYLIALFTYNYLQSRKITIDKTGFFLGDRKSGLFQTAASLSVSSRSSWLLLGITTQAYIMGFSAIWMVLGFFISEGLLFVFIFPLLRKFSGIKNMQTITDIFAFRFKDDSSSLKLIITSVLLFFTLVFISAQFIGGGSIFYALLGTSNYHGIIITAVVSLLLILIGGQKFLSRIDLFNSVLIFGSLVMLTVSAFTRIEGISTLQEEIIKNQPEFFGLKILAIGTFIGFVSVGFSSAGNPGILFKLMSVSEEVAFPRLAIFTTILNFLLAFTAILVGISARLFFPLIDAIPGADSQNAFIGLAGELLHPVLLGFVFCALFASLMSSASAQIMVSGSSLLNDIYSGVLSRGKTYTSGKLRFIANFAVVFIVYIALLPAILIEIDFNSFILFAWAGFGASFGPALLACFLWKGSSIYGIKAGVITGALTVLIWKVLPGFSYAFYELIPGVILSSIAIWIGSQLERKLIEIRFNKTAKYKTIIKTNYID